MDDDEELRRAIALSLQESQPPSRQSPPRTVPNDDDDDEAQFRRDLEMAMKASMSSSSNNPKNVHTDARSYMGASSTRAFPSEPVSELPAPLPQTQRMSDFLSTREERFRLEKERLERQNKRLREELEKKEGKGKGRARVGDEANVDVDGRPAKKARVNSTTSSQNNGNSSSQGPLYWDGVIRQTANRLVDKDKDTRPTIRLSEIITSKEDIEFAIIASYASMPQWIYEFFDPRTPVIFVVQPDETGNSRVIKFINNFLLTTPFLRGGRGCQHIKLILLFYKDGRLRVAIPTANFVDYDWRDIENTVWMQDIPKRPSPVRHDPKASDFPATLTRVLHSLNVPAAMNTLLNSDVNLPIEALNELRMRWDWSKVTAKLVASLAGKHEGWDVVNRSGHPALAVALKELGARPDAEREVVLECQGSSIGAYSTQWMNEFYCSARGESAKEWLDKAKSSRTKLPWPPIKIIYPTLQTVKDTVLGVPGGGTLFCRKNQWEVAKFPRELFHDSKSKRGGVLMHTKMILATFRLRQSVAGASRISMPDSEDEDTDGKHEQRGGGSSKNANGEVDKTLVGWVYVGSHNFTPSAWGTLSGSSSKPSLNNVNYEMGIVLPLKSLREVDDVVCWERPARKYVLNKDRAWIQDEILGSLRDGL